MSATVEQGGTKATDLEAQTILALALAVGVGDQVRVLRAYAATLAGPAALSEKQRADAAEADVLRLTKERDEARKIHTDYMKGQEPEERDWAAAFTDGAAAMVLQAFGRIRQPDGSAPTYQSLTEYQSRALDALHKAVVREAPFSAEGRAVLARAAAAEASAKALREALAEIVTHVDPDRMRVVAYAALAPPDPSSEKPTPAPARCDCPMIDGQPVKHTCRAAPLAEQEQIK